METFFTATLWATAIGCGLMAGVYFAFSTFVMKALAQTPAAKGISAMQSINKVIVSSAFLPLFFGTTVAAFILVALFPLLLETDGALFSAMGGGIYIVGMFICTVAFNVPLNNKLADLDPNCQDAALFWQAYQRTWTRWNHVRTAASTMAVLLFIHAISIA